MSLISAMLKTYKGNKLEHEEIEKLQNKRLKKLVEYARSIEKEKHKNFRVVLHTCRIGLCFDAVYRADAPGCVRCVSYGTRCM